MYKTRMGKLSLAIAFACVVMLIGVFPPKPTQAAGTCGTGSWQSGNLEIHHINIGQGDSTLIVGPTGKSLLFDAGESNWNSSAKAQIIGPYIQGVLGCNSLDYVVISHFHLDHIGYVEHGGLWHLVETQGFTVGSTLVRDYNTHLGDISGTFTNWKTYLEGAGQAKLHPVFAVEGTSQVDLGAGVTFNIVAVNGNGALIAGDFHGDASPPSENDYSIGAVLSYGDFDEWIGGDLDGHYEIGAFGYTYHDVELSTAPEVGDVDVYRANHHASSHSSSATFINQLDPEVSIVTVGDGNTYGHPTQEVMDHLLATSTVYMTERGDLGTDIGSAIVAGDIVIKTSDGLSYIVNGTSFTATEPTRTDVDGDGYFVEADPNDGSSSEVPAPNGGCDPIYQTCSISCQVTAGEVLINEVLPAPSSGPEWVELYNTTASAINIGYCYIDDIAGGSAVYQIPASTLIPAHGFWTLDRTSYFNNGGDDVRFLKEDASTALDSYSYGSTGYDSSWYRLPDGGTWAGLATGSSTKGYSNNPPDFPSVLSIASGLPNPTSASSVTFTVTFSEDVTGVDIGDFALDVGGGITGAGVTGGTGSGSTRIVTVNTGSGNGTLGLRMPVSATVTDLTGNPLIGLPFTGSGIYTIEKAPGAATLIAPSGNITTTTPTYTWHEVSEATWYYLWVNGPSGNVIKQWYEASAVCVGGTCSVTPTIALSVGAHKWWAQTWNSVGYGLWSAEMNFTVPTPTLPGKALLTKPTGNTFTKTPTYTWTAASDTTWYYLYVNGPSGNVIKLWYDASVICSSGTCSVTPTTALSAGAYKWWVQTWSSAGYGPWSDRMDFTVSVPGKATLTAPTGSITDTTPDYAWNAVEGATWYYLWVNNPAGTAVIKQWYDASLVCSGATCTATPTTMLGSGAHKWWVQTWSPVGYGPWSDQMNFTLP